MSIAIRVVARAKRSLPASPKQRVRLLFTAFALVGLLMAPLSGAAAGIQTGFGVAVATAVMWLLGDVVRAYERDRRRESVVTGLTYQLQEMECEDEMYREGVRAALDLVGPIPDAAVSLWRGDARRVRIGHHGGDLPDSVPLEIDLDTVPDHLRRSLLEGVPFVLEGNAARIVQQAVRGEQDSRSIFIAPLTHRGRFRGGLVVSSRQSLPVDLQNALSRLASAVGLALDRVSSITLLNRVVDSSSDAILLLGSDLRVDFASSAVEPMLGYAPVDLIGRGIDELLGEHRDDLRAVFETAASASARQDPDVFHMRHRDGSERRIEVASSRLSDVRGPGWVVNLRDVTQREKVERALRESEERFRSLAENVTEGLYRLNLHPEPRFEYVNPALEVMSGYPLRMFLEDPELPLRHVHPDDREIVERSRSNPEGQVGPAEVRWRHPELGWRWLSFREAVAYDDDGTPLSTMGIMSDVTARKQQEDTLRGALENERHVAEELRRVDVMKTTFIRAVSHELRTPLTAITAAAQILNREQSRLDGPTSAQLLKRLAANADKLERLLIDLLDLDRLSSDTIAPNRRAVDVAELCRRVVDQVDEGTHPITCTPGMLMAYVDAPKVERIVENLVRNALKHTGRDTPIVVDVAPDQAGDGAVFTVEDRGPGVPASLRAELFEPFVQGPASASSPNPGTGVGLALVARFAELHGGDAWLEEPAEGGARFCAWVPSGRPYLSAGDDHKAGAGVSGRLAIPS